MADRPEVAGETVKRIPGEEGLWVFLLGDMFIFAVMFVAFLNERAKDPELFAASRESVGLAIGLTNTMVLLISSALVVIGLRAVRVAAYATACRAYLGAVVCAVVFAAFKGVEYTHLIADGQGPESNPYFMWLFILTGVHLSHVVIGMPLLGVVATRARARIPCAGSGAVFYEGASCYWHLVDLLWMMLFPLVYLVA